MWTTWLWRFELDSRLTVFNSILISRNSIVNDLVFQHVNINPTTLTTGSTYQCHVDADQSENARTHQNPQAPPQQLQQNVARAIMPFQSQHALKKPKKYCPPPKCSLSLNNKKRVQIVKQAIKELSEYYPIQAPEEESYASCPSNIVLIHPNYLIFNIGEWFQAPNQLSPLPSLSGSPESTWL